jgi:protein ATS1
MPHLRVLAAGSNAHGQLANETFDDSHVFRPCVFASDYTAAPKLSGHRVLSIACGANHTLLLVELGHPSGQSHQPVRQLWGCGDGLKGQLGPSCLQGVSQSCSSSVFRRLDQNILGAASIDEEKYVIHAVAAAWESTFIALRPKHDAPAHSRDMVITMGNNDHGDLGTGLSPIELKYSHEPRRVALEEMLDTAYPKILTGFRIDDITAGLHHVIATLHLFLQTGEEDIVVGWGASRHEQLGSSLSQVPSKLDKSKVTRLSQFTSLPRILPAFQRTPGHNIADPVVTYALGSHHSVFLHHSGRITGLGSNKKGQLAGLRDPSGSVRDVRCTWNGTYLTLQSANEQTDQDHVQWEIQATGAGDKGQLGHSSAISESSTSGTRPIQFPFHPNTRRLVDMACGSEHVLVLLARADEQGSPVVEEQEVLAWGWNEHGNLGLGHTADAHLPVVIWPRPGTEHDSRVQSIWAGCGTSWIVESFVDV